MTAFFNVVLGGQDADKSYLTGADASSDASAGLISFTSKNGF